VYVVGGRSDANTPLNTIEKCEQLAGGPLNCVGKIDDVTPIGTMTVPRVNAAAFYEQNGPNPRVHIIGGEGQKSAECYTLATNMCGQSGSMMTERAFFTMTLSPMHGNKYLIVGGIDASGNPQKTTEIYDPGTKSFKQDLDLTTPRARHDTVILTDKWPLVIGGALGNTGTAETLHCASNDECAFKPNTYCSAIGTCAPFKQNGARCDVAKDCWDGECAVSPCESGNCVDGYCCNSACSGICEACDSTAPGAMLGTCVPIAGDPRPGHGECVAGDGDSLNCAGKCNGFDAMICVYPVGKPCGKACVAGDPQSSSQSLSCSDQGICDVVAFESSCNNFTCADKHTCNTSCSKKDDCITGYDCNTVTATCVEAQVQCGTQTNPDGTAEDAVVSAKDPSVVVVACGPYHCDAAKSECLTICATAYDCANGYTCDANKTCVPKDFDDTAGTAASCSASPANESSRFGWFAALTIAGIVVARRNRARA